MSIFTSCARYRKYLYREIDLFIYFLASILILVYHATEMKRFDIPLGKKTIEMHVCKRHYCSVFFFLYVSAIEYNRQNIWRSAVLKLDYTRLLFISRFLSSHRLDRTCQTIVLFYCHNCMMNVRRCIWLFITHNTREKHVLEFFCICFSIGNIYIYIYCFFFRLTEVFSY